MSVTRTIALNSLSTPLLALNPYPAPILPPAPKKSIDLDYHHGLPSHQYPHVHNLIALSGTRIPPPYPLPPPPPPPKRKSFSWIWILSQNSITGELKIRAIWHVLKKVFLGDLFFRNTDGIKYYIKCVDGFYTPV